MGNKRIIGLSSGLDSVYVGLCWRGRHCEMEDGIVPEELIGINSIHTVFYMDIMSGGF